MMCNVYGSARTRLRFLHVPSGTAISELPPEVAEEFSAASPWKTIDLRPEVPLVALDSAAAAESIEKQGYYIVDVQVIFEERIERT